MELIDYIMALRNLVRETKDLTEGMKRRLQFHLDDLFAALSDRPAQENLPPGPKPITGVFTVPAPPLIPKPGKKTLPHRPFPGGPLDT